MTEGSRAIGSTRALGVPASIGLVLCIAGAAAFLWPAPGRAASAPCGLANPAFCDTFDEGPAAIRGRGGSAGNVALLIDVPLQDLVSGLNTLDMLPLNAPMDYPPAVANLDLTLASGAAFVPTAPTNLRIISH